MLATSQSPMDACAVFILTIILCELVQWVIQMNVLFKHLGTSLKCPDYQGVLIFWVSSHVHGYFATIIMPWLWNCPYFQVLTGFTVLEPQLWSTLIAQSLQKICDMCGPFCNNCLIAWPINFNDLHIVTALSNRKHSNETVAIVQWPQNTLITIFQWLQNSVIKQTVIIFPMTIFSHWAQNTDRTVTIFLISTKHFNTTVTISQWP